ncbi:winged helix DNA-binding domain-containing protein [Chitinophaga sp. SYP-B3965]|uniref:winged helix DNA-binding domain-containing protein n=1 Tax=Chitinophaga sp. SYP-B3965 TaxID=2663120 RepID=UPI001562FC7F|nr:winged helix DNA-binding domain-containing protein [Chitinophaga sp. SYP-B3965]
MNQQLTRSAFSEPGELISWMGCLQAEEYTSAKWAIGNRIPHITDARIEKDFNEGRFFRAQVLRPAWHFVAPADIGWLLNLSAHRIKAFYKQLHGKLDISNSDLKRSKHIITKALTGGEKMTRNELLTLCLQAKMRTDEIRINFLLMDAELDGLIVNGGRQGNEFTYELREERMPVMEKEAAIAELARRYFISRGPATLPDFVWWSGLELAEAKMGLEMIKDGLQYAVINGEAYWFFETPVLQEPDSVSLLPSFDEFTVGYKDRVDEYKPSIIIDGQVAGTWKYSEKRHKIRIETQLFVPLQEHAENAVLLAGREYARFLGKAI